MLFCSAAIFFRIFVKLQNFGGFYSKMDASIPHVNSFNLFLDAIKYGAVGIC